MRRVRVADAKHAFEMGARASTSQSLQRKRAQIAILAAEGNLEEARKVGEEFTKQLATEGDLTKPNFQAEEDWLQWALEVKPLVN